MTATANRGNVPGEMTTFIGRRRLLQEVKSSLTTARLVTLVGPGASGRPASPFERRRI